MKCQFKLICQVKSGSFGKIAVILLDIDLQRTHSDTGDLFLDLLNCKRVMLQI